MTIARPTTATAKRLVVLHGGGEHSRMALFDPWAPDCADAVYLPYYFYAVEHPQGWVLIDCGAHPDLARDPRGRLGEQADYSDVVMTAGDDVVSRLATLGITADEVRHVVATHLHYDHCGGLALLPEATVHIQPSELAFASDPPTYQRAAYVPADWAHVKTWAMHDGEHDLFSDGSIRLIPTPGHTPGHQSVLVALPDRWTIVVADAAYHPQKMAERKLPGYLWSPDALMSTWDLLERLAGEHGDAELLFSHYPAPAAVPRPLGHCAQ